MILALALLLAAAPPLTVDQIVAKNLAARGGAAKLRAVRSERLLGRISFGSGAAGLRVLLERPGKLREEVTVEGHLSIRATNGKTGFTFDGVKVTPVDRATLRGMAANADFDGPLLDYRKKGSRVTLESSGEEGYRLRVQQKDGQVRYDIIDPATFLESRWESVVEVNGKELRVGSSLSDYREVSGIKLPFRIDSGAQRIDWFRIEVDPPLDEDDFEAPQAPQQER